MCTTQFKFKSWLDRHSALHEKGKFKCELCENTYKRQDSLTEHIKKHLVNIKLTCEHCNKKFTERRNLLAHIKNLYRLPGTASPYCAICERSFSCKKTLRYHINLHNNIKPFTCHCGAQFSAPNNLSRHKQKVIKIKYI